MNKLENSPNDKKSRRGSMGVYSSLVSGQKRPKNSKPNTSKKDGSSHLRPLPKEPVPRFFAHFRWERIKAYWFSKAGLKRIGKIFAACILLGIIGIGALFIYYKSQLKEIKLGNLTIDETVNTYLDRNGVVLWEDKGVDDYRLVVDEADISTYVRQATVAIEDRNFYHHPGVDLGALVRAVLSTVSGRGVQGGSTLTQQLIKQVYFSDEAASENRGGITRKIKELILSIELEKMYSKEQIITMYLNESPYGGRRNGIESAAQTYFGKNAKDLNLAESALLAAVPNNPAVLNPYNEAGHEGLIARQHKVLDVMVEMGYISQAEADEAKAVPILDQIIPESNQYENMLAPHFVMEVKHMLEEKYGIQTMRSGGFTIKTTLDYRAQEIAQEAVAAGDALRYLNGSDNIALASVDVETSQVLAMVGSINWDTPIYGEVNATTSLLEPGSTIKPVLDYSALFSIKDGDVVYGPGTVLKDENIDSLYCAGYTGACALRNASGQFYGNLTIRQSLGNSLNIGAVKALYLSGIDNALAILRGLGDKSYCVDNDQAGLSMAIGSGCGVRAIEHANTYASVARGGSYKDLVYVLEMKDASGKVVETWQDSAGERIIDEEVAYLLADILSDPNARKITFGGQANSFGFVVPGVWTASKTGTTTTTNSAVAKDAWMASFSTAVATVVWNGNHDGAGLTSSTNEIVRRVVNDYMERVHKEIYASEGRWSPEDKPIRPAGIQSLTVGGKTDIWPSWYNNKKSGVTKTTLIFNKENHLLATSCTPESKKIEIEVTKMVDPTSGTEIWYVPEPYNDKEKDPCTNTPDEDRPPTIDITTTKGDGSSKKTLTVAVTKGSEDLKTYKLFVDGARVSPQATNSGGVLTLTYALKGNEKSVSVEVTDAAGNSFTQGSSINGPNSSSDND